MSSPQTPRLPSLKLSKRLGAWLNAITWALLLIFYWLTWPLRFLGKRLLGYDVFISYARADGLDYASHLESSLSPALICYRDEGDASTGRPLAEIIEKGLRRSRALVVIVTAQACQSLWVKDELEIFAKDEDAKRQLLGAKYRPKLIFPIFVAPSTPENLPEHLTWLRAHLGVRDTATVAPSRETVAKIRSSFLGVPKALKMYGAGAVLLTLLLAAVFAMGVSRMAEARKTWLTLATKAEAAGDMSGAEWLVAKAAEASYTPHREDVEFYTRLRSRRMLSPAGSVPIEEDAGVMCLLNFGSKMGILQTANNSSTVQYASLTDKTVVPLLQAGDHIPHFAVGDQEVWVAAGNQLAWLTLADQRVHGPVTLPGPCHEMRLVGAELRLLCSTDEGISIIFARCTTGQWRSEKVSLKGEPPSIQQMMLLGGGESACCSLQAEGLRLALRQWSRRGDELNASYWTYPEGNVMSPTLVHGDRYILFTSMSFYPGDDPRKEPRLLAVDRLYPEGGFGGRPIQQVAASEGVVESVERSNAFAAALGVGRELRLWEEFNPPRAQQVSLPVTDGVRSLAVWSTPPTTTFFPAAAAVVAVAKEHSLEVYTERLAEGTGSRPAVPLVSSYPLPSIHEIGHTLISQDGAFVAVTLWRNEGDKVMRQIALFKRAAPASAPLQIPSSDSLILETGLTKSEVSSLAAEGLRQTGRKE